MSVRFGTIYGRLTVSFDADDGQNDDGRGLLRRVDAPEAHDAPLIGEFDNGAHSAAQPVHRLPAADPLTRRNPAPAIPASKPHAGLTLR